MIFLIFELFFVFFTHTKTAEIAVCITGQRSRFLPKLIAPLFQNNEKHTFKLFYKFENSSVLKYSTEPSKRFDPSPYATKDASDMKKTISQIYEEVPNVSVESVVMVNAKTRQEWIKELGHQALNTIRQYANIQENLLNMYEKIQLCGETLREYEVEKKKKFDYVISTREDITLMQTMDLDRLLPKIRNSALSSKRESCDVLAKNCLAWGGINMRLWVMSGTNGIRFISSKINYYKELLKSRKQVHNPEAFDLAHLGSLAMNHCGVSVNEFPVTAARHTFNENYCFINLEISNCIPAGLENIINSKKC